MRSAHAIAPTDRSGNAPLADVKVLGVNARVRSADPSLVPTQRSILIKGFSTGSASERFGEIQAGKCAAIVRVASSLEHARLSMC
jgi:hypothetical protein